MDLPFGDRVVFTFLPSARMAAGKPDAYVFAVSGGPEPDLRLARRDWAPVEVQDAEARWYEAYVRAYFARYGVSYVSVTIPSTKPAYSEFFGDSDGRIWVLRQGRGVALPCATEPADGRRRCWADEPLLDLFEVPEGFVAEVEIPETFANITALAAEGCDLYLAGLDLAGEPLLAAMVVPIRRSCASPEASLRDDRQGPDRPM